MSVKTDGPLVGRSEYEHLTDDDLRKVARFLFKKVDMVRAFDQDFQIAVEVLRDIYNRGKARGVVSAE